MTYKEVFQLAQDRGWRPLIIRVDGIHSLLAIAELSLLQKWLRDEHGIDIEVFNQYTSAKEGRLYAPKILADSRKVLTNQSTYEQALLEGVNEALKLIKPLPCSKSLITPTN